MTFFRFCCASALLLASQPLIAAPVIEVFPSVAPNAFGSPNYNAYQANAISALQAGASSAGTPGTPSYYSQVPSGSHLPVGAFTVTNFNSWMGNANPTATFGPAFGNEYGNRVHYGLHITSDTPFSISQLAFNGTYDDANYSDYSVVAFGAGSYQYGPGYVGLNYGLDGQPGGGDDILITGGPNTQLVHELFGRGSGIGYEVLTSFPGATNQQKIDDYNLATWGTDWFSLTGTYTLGGAVGSASVVFNPEPASLAAWSLITLTGSIVAWRKRRRRVVKSRTPSISNA